MKEAEFGRSLSGQFRKAGLDVTRIESHYTGNGIPDMFVQGYGKDFWLELKSDKSLKPNLKSIKVDWRPGQQAWMVNYFMCHTRHKQCLTIIKASIGYYVVPMFNMYINNTVSNPIWIKDCDTLLFIILTNSIGFNTKMTNREAVNMWMDTWFPQMDYDPEVLWEDEDIDSSFNFNSFYYKQIEMYFNLGF